jgi:hypothetical protein
MVKGICAFEINSGKFSKASLSGDFHSAVKKSSGWEPGCVRLGFPKVIPQTACPHAYLFKIRLRL